LIPSTGLPIERQSLLTDIEFCTIKLSHKWLPVGFRERRCGYDFCQAFNLRPFPHLYAIMGLGVIIISSTQRTSKHITAAFDAPLQGIQHWF
jgi:hypothetical protein